MPNDNKSLSHTKWNCKYHIVFAPKYRRKVSFQEKREAIALVDKLADVLSEDTERAGVHMPAALQNEIALNHVSYAYTPDGENALNDVSFRFKAGKNYAIVGPSGSGKSTLMNFLLSACDAYTGSITIDGTELSTISADSLSDIIMQNVFIFNDTIRTNITMFGSFPE